MTLHNIRASAPQWPEVPARKKVQRRDPEEPLIELLEAPPEPVVTLLLAPPELAPLAEELELLPPTPSQDTLLLLDLPSGLRSLSRRTVPPGHSTSLDD